MSLDLGGAWAASSFVISSGELLATLPLLGGLQCELQSEEVLAFDYAKLCPGILSSQSVPSFYPCLPAIYPRKKLEAVDGSFLF